MMRWFRTNRDHLWCCPLTGGYHDPRVLIRALCDLPDPLGISDLRRVMRLTAVVTADGHGFSEAQVEDAYNRFLAWYEGKGSTAGTSPTPAPSTASPAT